MSNNPKWNEEVFAAKEAKRLLNEQANDFSRLKRGPHGEVHTELRPDTIVEINGMTMTYQSAINAGLASYGKK